MNSETMAAIAMEVFILTMIAASAWELNAPPRWQARGDSIVAYLLIASMGFMIATGVAWIIHMSPKELNRMLAIGIALGARKLWRDLTRAKRELKKGASAAANIEVHT